MAPRAYPRNLAVSVLTRVLSDGNQLDEGMNAALSGGSADLPPEARSWLQEVCSGTLRWKGRLDLAVDSTALKKKPSGWLRKILLIAAYQLIVQERTSPAAVVSETVDEVKRKEGDGPAKFANAALRKISAHAGEWRALALRPGATRAEAAAWASLPEWLWARIEKDQGTEWSAAFAQAALQRPPLWLRARRDDWRPASAEPGPVPGSWRLSGGGLVTEMPGFGEGEFIVQDISSQILVHEIASVVSRAVGRKSFRVLDLCAAPGGKAVGLAWEGAEVKATDRDERNAERIALLEQTVKRAAPGKVQILPRSAVPALETQDLVWVDAPCTGTGILRRHPDVRWLRQEKELASLKEIQLQLLAEAWEKVRVGGFLAYSVCSVLKEEGPDRVATAGLSAAERVQEWSLSPQLDPYGDGFWGVLMKKTS